MFLILGVGIAVFGFLQKYLFTYTGENLTLHYRRALYEGIIYKHIAWFDSKDKAPGVLSNVLSEDISALNGMTTESIYMLLECAFTLLIALALSLFYSW